MSGCGLSHKSAENGYKSFECQNQREREYVYESHKLEVTSREFNSVANQLGTPKLLQALQSPGLKMHSTS